MQADSPPHPAALGKLRCSSIPVILGIIFYFTAIDCVPFAPLTGCARTTYLQSCKIGCAIGACGACTVFVTSSPATGKVPCLRNVDRISWLRRLLRQSPCLSPPPLYTLLALSRAGRTALPVHSPQQLRQQGRRTRLTCGQQLPLSLRAGPKSPRTLNACLAPVASLAGCEVATSQGLGNSKAGFHAIQGRVGPAFLACLEGGNAKRRLVRLLSPVIIIHSVIRLL